MLVEQAHELAIAARVAAQDARTGLLHHLLYERCHGIKLIAQSLQRQLLQDVCRPFHSFGDLFRVSLGLSQHSAGGIEQLAVGALELVLALFGLGARRAGDVEHP